MELINRIRKSRKGFTLVEIIVVLVILAILAAFMIPSMLGFVGDAKKKAAIAEQREVYVAAQAIVTERFAKNKTTAPTELGMGTIAESATDTEATNLSSGKALTASPTGTGVDSQMKNYISADLKPAASGSSGSIWAIKVDAEGHVTEVTYTRDGVVLEPLKPNKTITN